jgi:hypothetical protein
VVTLDRLGSSLRSRERPLAFALQSGDSSPFKTSDCLCLNPAAKCLPQAGSTPDLWSRLLSTFTTWTLSGGVNPLCSRDDDTLHLLMPLRVDARNQLHDLNSRLGDIASFIRSQKKQDKQLRSELQNARGVLEKLRDIAA